ncbi:DUF3866 family protein [Ornithinimicrobium avium]|uniref:DUF3866 family protein n=1 Tax=Ornithinimicrobium avium TaxID=2283195 RepID=A0A345NJK9_9MICO|nr:DUF3866 family protein [Ornithinimicrobium avium]AXH95217.1 DUF3866 family protein [Ornithinimicrobium avium]
MIQWREGIVTGERPGWEGVVVLDVAVEARGTVRALAYRDVVGTPVAGDRVLLNTTALERDLGTGGYAVVVAVPDRPGAWPSPDPDAPGHLVKARYTPLQTMVLGADDPEGEHHVLLEDADDLDGMPVVAADLHSALPAVLAGVRTVRPEARVAYVMTDGGALPAAFSRTCADLRAAGWLAATVTAGQAYGGDLEAVTVHSALLAAHHLLGADLVVVVQGPGNLGTGTRWGFSGVHAGEALNAAAVLGGRAVASLRVSQSDPRPRHRGLSHHSATAYARVLAHPAEIVVPVGTTGLPDTDRCLTQVRAQVDDLVGGAPHLSMVEVVVDGLLDALREVPVRLSTMGRGLEQDTASFLAAAAAGAHAARRAGA